MPEAYKYKCYKIDSDSENWAPPLLLLFKNKKLIYRLDWFLFVISIFYQTIQKWFSENIYAFLFQDTFCQLLNMECPTEEQYEATDVNGDRNLTWLEYLEANFGMLFQESRGLAEEFEFWNSSFLKCARNYQNW